MAEKKKPETGSTHEQYRRVLRTAYPDSNAPKSPEFAEKVASRHQFDPASLDRDCSCGWKACNSFRYVESYLKEAWKKHVAEARICPVCGEPMSLHSFERETNVSVCPAPAVSLPPIVLEPQESAVRWKGGDRVRFIVRPGGDHPYANAYTVTEIVGGLVMLAGLGGGWDPRIFVADDPAAKQERRGKPYHTPRLSGPFPLTLEMAIELAARDLPDGYNIELNVERGAGWVDAYPHRGVRLEFECVDRTLAQQVMNAIRAAREREGLPFQPEPGSLPSGADLDADAAEKKAADDTGGRK